MARRLAQSVARIVFHEPTILEAGPLMIVSLLSNLDEMERLRPRIGPRKQLAGAL